MITLDAREDEGSKGLFPNLRRSIEERGSTLSGEILSGLIIYLSLVYIFIVNPEMLSAAGTPSDPIPANAILLATVIMSASATILMGVIANLPLAVAPGLEISAFFTFVLVKGMHLDWRQAFAAVFISGILNVLLTAFSFRERIVESIPEGLKASLLVAVGAFIALVGLKIGGIVNIDSRSGFTVFAQNHNLERPFIMLLGATACFTLNTGRFVLPWGIIISVILTTATAAYFGIQPTPQQERSGSLTEVMLSLDFSKTLSLNFIAGALILFVIDFIGGMGKIIALTTYTTMQTEGRVDRLKYALFIDGLATTLGSLLGTSSLIAFVESRLGIEAGARTGVAAIVCGLMMLSGLFYSGVFRLVPPIASAGILLYIGILLIRVNVELLRGVQNRKLDISIGLAMAVAVALTFQMDVAMFIGFTAYSATSWLKPNAKRTSFWLAVVAAILGCSIILPILLR